MSCSLFYFSRILSFYSISLEYFCSLFEFSGICSFFILILFLWSILVLYSISVECRIFSFFILFLWNIFVLSSISLEYSRSLFYKKLNQVWVEDNDFLQHFHANYTTQILNKRHRNREFVITSSRFGSQTESTYGRIFRRHPLQFIEQRVGSNLKRRLRTHHKSQTK